MPGFRVVVTDQVFPDVEVERALIEAAGGTLTVAGGGRADVLAAAADADALLNTYLGFDAEAIARLGRCKIIARYGIGVDNVDLAAAATAGIAVTNVPDYCVEEVASHTVGLVLSLVRRIPAGDAIVRAGGWGIGELGELHRVSGLTVGLLGYGKIARLVSAVLRPLGVPVAVYDPYVTTPEGDDRLVDLDELLATSDAVCVHCPLTPETRGLLDAKRLATMKPGAYLVNTSRGPIVVLDDLVAALRAGTLAGAALDVFDQEPPPVDTVRATPNLLATPHSAFYSVEAVQESQRKAATQVVKAIAGEPLDYRVA
ncbi:MAG: C-terminal binding protein [Streptosporangiales bacterium]|nr:C-terminal binding protein [Streptosporangiales bacterium]